MAAGLIRGLGWAEVGIFAARRAGSEDKGGVVTRVGRDHVVVGALSGKTLNLKIEIFVQRSLDTFLQGQRRAGFSLCAGDRSDRNHKQDA